MSRTQHDEQSELNVENWFTVPLKTRFCSTCRYHAFDNTRKETEDNTQVPELMEKVEEMITDNQGLF